MLRYQQLRDKMVREQLIPRGIDDPGLLAVMGRVPRHEFVDQALAQSAYKDHPLPIGQGQTISQPYIVAMMSQALALTGRENVLEIGTGCGYQTAVLANLAARVCTVERLRSLSMAARRRLSGMGLVNILYRVGDGTLGWPEQAPFDAIIVTAAGPEIPASLLAQLAEGGRMVIPVGRRNVQSLTVAEKRQGQVVTRNIESVRFVSLVGKEGWGDKR